MSLQGAVAMLLAEGKTDREKVVRAAFLEPHPPCPDSHLEPAACDVLTRAWPWREEAGPRRGTGGGSGGVVGSSAPAAGSGSAGVGTAVAAAAFMLSSCSPPPCAGSKSLPFLRPPLTQVYGK